VLTSNNIDVEKMNAKMLKAYFTAAWRHTARKNLLKQLENSE
jgi:hypothetical protein